MTRGVLVPTRPTGEMVGESRTHHGQPYVTAGQWEAMLAAIPDAYARLREAELRVIEVAKEWNSPGNCDCVTARCDGACLPARTRDALAYLAAAERECE